MLALKTMAHRCCSLALLVLVGIIVPGHNAALAQSGTGSDEAVEVPPELGPEAIQSLVSKLDETQTAALVDLIGLISTTAGAEAATAVDAGPPASEIIKGWFIAFGANFERYLLSFPEMLSSIAEAFGLIFSGRDTGGSFQFLLLVVAIIAAGLAAEWLFNRPFVAKRERIRESSPDRILESLRLLSTRAGLEIGGVIVFAIVALVMTRILAGSADDQRLISAFLLYVIVIPRLFGAVMHFVLAPRRPELRLVHVDSSSALFLERNLTRIVVIIGITLFLSVIMVSNNVAHFDSVRFWLGLAIHLWLIAITLKARKGLTQIIEGGEENLTRGLQLMASWWPGVSAAFIGFNWLFLQFVLSAGHATLSPQRSVSAILLIVLAPFLDTIVRGIAGQLVPTDDGSDKVVARAHHETRLAYIRIGRVLLLGLLIVAVGQLWGVNLMNIAEAGFGAQIAAKLVGALLIVAIGYFAWEITNLWINRRLARELPDTGGEQAAEGGTGQTRMATVLPILRITLQVTIIIMTALLALSQLGVNITPLLAGAGVLGLAIGFGAQTLVKDVVSGVFFLLDDAFRLGEFIAVGSTMGVVQKISVRSVHLRQDTGPIHIIPYGSMSQLTNNSRDYVTMKLRFTVPFDTDQDKVRKLFKKIGQQMMEVPELAEVLINPFKSQGAAEITDIGIVIRGKFTTVPGGQFLIRKEVYSRVQKAFEANGIEFARREVRVRLPEHVDAENLSEEEKEAISAAASQAAETPPPGKPAP